MNAVPASFVLERAQTIPRPIEEVFAFFEDAKNLEAITPSWLGFRILTPDPIELRAGAFIRYQIRWHGFPLNWTTEIESWSPPTEFVDVQIRGPYRLWHHTHRFQAVEGGTLMSDMVRYALPLGLLGQFAHAWRVKSDLKTIFDYRARKVSELLRTKSVHG